jgi:hypothetical protein
VPLNRRSEKAGPAQGFDAQACGLLVLAGLAAVEPRPGKAEKTIDTGLHEAAERVTHKALCVNSIGRGSAVAYHLQNEQQAARRDAEWGERFFHLVDPDGHELSFARPLRSSV